VAVVGRNAQNYREIIAKRARPTNSVSGRQGAKSSFARSRSKQALYGVESRRTTAANKVKDCAAPLFFRAVAKNQGAERAAGGPRAKKEPGGGRAKLTLREGLKRNLSPGRGQDSDGADKSRTILANALQS
jgi:hypothetical protein